MDQSIITPHKIIDSTAADVYSFGVVLNELLTREQPFRGTCHKCLQETPHTALEPLPRVQACPFR